MRLAAAHLAGGFAAAVPVLGYFAAVGALRDFWDCVLGHNISYSAQMPLYLYPASFMLSFPAVFRQWWPILAFAVVGLRTPGDRSDGFPVWMRSNRLAGLWLLASFAGVSIGGYYREHYYIQAIPPVAVLAGRGVVRMANRWAPKRAGLTSALLAAATVVYGVLVAPWYYLLGTPAEKCRAIYGEGPFTESLAVADYLARHTDPDDAVFIYGSEPQIPFYAGRKSASRYIFTYPVTTPTSATVERQHEVVRELTDHPPRVIITVNVRSSHILVEETPMFFTNAVAQMLAQDYRLVAVIGPADRAVRPFAGTVPADQVLQPPVEHSLAIWERRGDQATTR
jgi:hypothetical protein